MNKIIIEKPRVAFDGMKLVRHMAKILKFEPDREPIDKICVRYHRCCEALENLGADRIVGLMAEQSKLARDGAADKMLSSNELREERKKEKRAQKEKLQAVFDDSRALGVPLRKELAELIEKHVEKEIEAERKRYEKFRIPYIDSDLSRAMKQALEIIQKPIKGAGQISPAAMFCWIEPSELPQRDDA